MSPTINKILVVVFYIGLALYFGHVAFPYLETIIAIAALILGILSLI